MVGQASARLSRKHFRVITVLCADCRMVRRDVIDRLGIFADRLKCQNWNSETGSWRTRNLRASHLVCVTIRYGTL